VLTTGAGNVILKGRSFLGPYQQGNIGLITQSRPPQPEPPEPKPAAPVCPLNDCARLPIPSPPAEPPKLAPEKVFDELEENFTKEYESYLGVQGTRVKSLKETQKELEKAQRDTGMNTALVYIFFSNKSLGSKVLDAKHSTGALIPLLQIEAASASSLKDKHILHILLVTSQKACVISVRSNVNSSDKGFEVSENQCSSQNAPHTSEIFVTFDEIRQHISKFREPESQYWESEFIPASEQLYRNLVKPIEQDLKNIDQLTFIMDRGLRSLPLAALYTGEKTNIEGEKNHSYLVQKYGVSLAPSYSLLRTDYQKFPDCNEKDCNEKLWVLGTSTFPKENQPQIKEKPSLILANLQMEILSEKVWGASNSKIFRDEYFRTTQLQACPPNSEQDGSCRSDVRVVHLVTHANFSGNPKNSYIYFGKGEKLSLTAVQDLHLDSPPPPPIELFVITAACETALGSENAELGFAGAAVKTRVKTVMASLWMVEEINTLAFNLEFYQQLKRSRTKSDALRKTQRAMISGKTKITIHDDSYELHTSLGSHFMISRLINEPGTKMDVPVPTKKVEEEKGRQDKKPNDKRDPNYLKDPNSFYFKHPGSWAGYTLIGTPW
jgi:CHAT domain-containing protein